MQSQNLEIRIQIFECRGSRFRFGTTTIVPTKQDRPGQIGFLDLVKINNLDMPQAHQGKILQDFIPQSSRTDDKHSCLR